MNDSAQFAGGPVLVVALRRPPRNRALVAEQLAEALRASCVSRDQPVPVVVADLVAQVAEHGAIALAHLLAHVLAKREVGLVDVERDDAVVVAGHHGLVLGALEKAECEPALRAFLRATAQAA